ncbi:hypothetical protein TorRG33x02_143730 [Trema orientale]|uniref:Secreted protein n=1 Tax=Trema orientale TaxID=63057 RepID=A0A2P5EWE1_TREOI|nr:hypothetical protein TorRG33x02_143730 [Trema orientale]
MSVVFAFTVVSLLSVSSRGPLLLMSVPLRVSLIPPLLPLPCRWWALVAVVESSGPFGHFVKL